MLICRLPAVSNNKMECSVVKFETEKSEEGLEDGRNANTHRILDSLQLLWTT